MSFRVVGTTDLGKVGVVFLFGRVRGEALKSAIEDLLFLAGVNRRCYIAEYPGVVVPTVSFRELGMAVAMASTTPGEADALFANLGYNCRGCTAEEGVVLARVIALFRKAWKAWEADERPAWATDEAMAALVKSRRVA